MLHSYNSGYSCSFYSDIMCLEHSQTIPTWCCGGQRPPLRIINSYKVLTQSPPTDTKIRGRMLNILPRIRSG